MRPMVLEYYSCSRAISREKRDTKKMTRVVEERKIQMKAKRNVNMDRLPERFGSCTECIKYLIYSV